MGKGTAIGIVISLIIGVGIGYYLMPMIFTSQAGDYRETFFYDSYDQSWIVPATAGTIPNLCVNFSTNPGDSLLITFTCGIELTPSSNPQTLVLDFWINFSGTLDSYGHVTYRLRYEADGLYTILDTFIIRYVKTDFSPGSHNVTVFVDPAAIYLDQNIYCSSLTVAIL